MIEFTVFGKPAPMGSKKAFVIPRTNRATIVDDNKPAKKQWQGAVSDKAAEVMEGEELLCGPVRLSVRFYFARPKSHFGTGRNAQTLKPSAPRWHSQKPDVDKLIRCLSDALTGIVWRDDAQVTSLSTDRNWTTGSERAEIKILQIGETPCD